MNYEELKRKIVLSGVFDPKYYQAKYLDVPILTSRTSNIDPLDHYILIGSRLGRLPHQAFTPKDLPPVPWETSLKDLPVTEFIRTNELAFDSVWYLQKYKDVSKAGADPLKHYRTSGRYEGRSPNRNADLIKELDAGWYERMYADQIGDGSTPVRHYLTIGAAEGNLPNNRQRKAGDVFRRFGPSEYSSKVDFHIEADTVTPLVEGFDLTIAVHMHIFYDSLLEEMSEHVSTIPTDYDVFISIPEGTYDIEQITKRARHCLKGCRNIVIRAFRNIGRDVAPMLAGFGPELLNYDLLLHMHSKRSLHNPAQSAWRRYLLHYTCGNRNITNQILNHFAAQPMTGGCFPPYYGNLRDQPSWGLNLANVTALCDRLGIERVDPSNVPDFPAGSFFWIRTSAIKPLLNGTFTYGDFDPELGQTDKTIAHAIERLLGHVPETLGYANVMPFVDLAYDLRHYYPASRTSPVWGSKRIDIDKIVAARASRPKNRTAIVTAITGGFDPLIIHEALSDDIDYICFSNDPHPDGYGLYDVRIAPYVHADARRMARFVKTNLAHLLPEYETIIWIDGNLQLTAPIDGLIAEMKQRGFSIAAIPHPTRSTVQEEADVAIRFTLDDPGIIRTQMKKYDEIDPGLSSERLIESNFMIFDMTDPRVAQVTDLWWSEIQAHSKRDQLSLNHALRTHALPWMPIFNDQSSMRDAPFSRMFSHGTGPNYAPDDEGCLRLISADARKGQEVRPAQLRPASTVDELKRSRDDGRVELERFVEPVDKVLLGRLDAMPASENPDDMQTDRLPNGVSLANWVPRRWSRQHWSVSLHLSKLHGAACFGGTITKTFVDGHDKGQLVLTNDGMLCDASFGVWNGERLLPRTLLTPVGDSRWRLAAGLGPQTLRGDHVLLGSLQPHFGHSILEGLSRVWALLEYPDLLAEMPLLVFEHRLRAYQSRFLELAGVDVERIVHAPEEGVTVERLWVPDPAIRSHRWISTRQGKVWQRISSAISTAEPHRRVYLSRRFISERPLVNEAEVEQILAAEGFEIIHPETLPLDEQIRVAAEAVHIVGPVGSQMYLAAFQKPGTHKTILAPSNFYAKDDMMISNAIGNSCDVLFGERIDNFANRTERRWLIDLQRELVPRFRSKVTSGG
ncbi:MAG: glycosyltransferase 61 family protein [Paracoccus sp.]|nr:glycosyltransferase 61 family protein [Paracoccus sp. (in: a-proteobacteria)]